jgi:hypothetical protein
MAVPLLKVRRLVVLVVTALQPPATALLQVMVRPLVSSRLPLPG